MLRPYPHESSRPRESLPAAGLLAVLVLAAAVFLGAVHWFEQVGDTWVLLVLGVSALVAAVALLRQR